MAGDEESLFALAFRTREILPPPVADSEWLQHGESRPLGCQTPAVQLKSSKSFKARGMRRFQHRFLQCAP